MYTDRHAGCVIYLIVHLIAFLHSVVSSLMCFQDTGHFEIRHFEISQKTKYHVYKFSKFPPVFTHAGDNQLQSKCTEKKGGT